MKLYKVSILIPTYNRERIILETLNSAVNQTYKNTEVIVVDNMSTDNSYEIIKEFAKSHPNVRAYQNETNIGPVLNWQRCIDEAEGLYGKLLFSDDLIEPDYLEKTLPFFTRYDVGFVFTSVTMGREPGQGHISYNFADETGIYPASDFINASLFGGDVPISPGCAIFRMADLKSNLVLNIPSPTINDFLAHGAGPDLLLYLLTAKAYKSIAYVKDALCVFREHKDSISVADKGQYLYRCYLQAKIWFAEAYFNKGMLKDYYANAWYQFCRSTKHWIKPSIFLASYSYNSNVILFVNILKVLALRILGKVRIERNAK
jgi:glycosyltransferase involved in cell wall biosynthesis